MATMNQLTHSLSSSDIGEKDVEARVSGWPRPDASQDAEKALPTVPLATVDYIPDEPRAIISDGKDQAGEIAGFSIDGTANVSRKPWQSRVAESLYRRGGSSANSTSFFTTIGYKINSRLPKDPKKKRLVLILLIAIMVSITALILGLAIGLSKKAS
jgi:hypothetical protein